MQKTILIIDDERSTRVLIRLILEKGGYCALEAENGKKGIKMFSENKIDLVVTDIVMPEKEGLETIVELRKACPGIKIIAISSGGADVDNKEVYLEMATMLGADQSLTKPINSEGLLASIKALLGSS